MVTPLAASRQVDRTRDWAESGLVALTGPADGPPVVPPGRAASYARELSSWIGAATADTAHPVRVDGGRLLSERAAYTGGVRGGNISVGRRCRLLPTADGWAAVSCARPDDAALHGAEMLGIAAAPVVRRASAPTAPAEARPRSVEGLLVVDFSALWAGPLCSHLLGAAGARVIKVETPNRPDGARFGDRGFYDLLHSGHESVVLDPDTEFGRRALALLVDAADIVVEASRPRALERFGLDATAACAAGTTWVSITARGRDSPTVGFGDDVAASSGLVAADAAGAPMFVGDAIADPLTGLTAAVRAMSEPPGGGPGHLWEVAMSEVVASTLVDVAEPQPRVRRRGDRWVVDGASGEVDIAEPRRRAGAFAPAPAAGRDTERVLRELEKRA